MEGLSKIPVNSSFHCAPSPMFSQCLGSRRILHSTSLCLNCLPPHKVKALLLGTLPSPSLTSLLSFPLGNDLSAYFSFMDPHLLDLDSCADTTPLKQFLEKPPILLMLPASDELTLGPHLACFSIVLFVTIPSLSKLHLNSPLLFPLVLSCSSLSSGFPSLHL